MQPHHGQTMDQTKGNAKQQGGGRHQHNTTYFEIYWAGGIRLQQLTPKLGLSLGGEEKGLRGIPVYGSDGESERKEGGIRVVQASRWPLRHGDCVVMVRLLSHRGQMCACCGLLGCSCYGHPGLEDIAEADHVAGDAWRGKTAPTVHRPPCLNCRKPAAGDPAKHTIPLRPCRDCG